MCKTLFVLLFEARYYTLITEVGVVTADAMHAAADHNISQ